MMAIVLLSFVFLRFSLRCRIIKQMFDTMFYVFMRVYLIWRHCKFKPVNCTVPHRTPDSADTAASSVTHAVVTTSSVCRVIYAAFCSFWSFFFFFLEKKALILPVSVFSAVYWQVLYQYESASLSEHKSCRCRLVFFFPPWSCSNGMTALHKRQCEAGAGVLCVQAYILYSRKLTVTYDCWNKMMLLRK